MKDTTRHLLNAIGKSGNRKAEICRFIITGVIATAIQYSFYLLFIEACSFPAVFSTIISYCISFLANYIISNIFTFRTRPTKRNAVLFLLSHLVNLGMQSSLVAIFSRYLTPAYALLPAMAICVPCNFLMVRFALKSKETM
ncbi:MAG: GtrA family protein [Muribaculaceae bacterium]|nr:GtrA family protein [Muribaculaceae bacterium]